MRRRCANKADKYYGGKGVEVCAEWGDYVVFRDWAYANGYQYMEGVGRGDRLSIERTDSGKGYCPENCEWITGRENSRRMVAAMLARKAAV